MTEDDIAPLAGPAFAGAFHAAIAFTQGNAMSNDPQPSYELVHLMTDYASRYGYLLGGLEMIAEGLATADAVLEAYRKKYEQPKPDAVTKPLPSETTAYVS